MSVSLQPPGNSALPESPGEVDEAAAPNSSSAAMRGPDVPTHQDRFANFLIRYQSPLLIAAVALTLLAWWPAQQLRFDQSIESLYAPENPRLKEYQQSKGYFGNDEFVILAFQDEKLFEESGQLSPDVDARLRQLTSRLREIPGVQTDSVQSISEALRAPFVNVPFIRKRVREFLQGLLLGDDERTTAVMLRLLPEKNAPLSRAETLRRIHAIAAQQPTPTYVVGEPVQVQEMFRYVEEDGATLGWASSGLLMVMIFLFFRRVRWMLLPLVVVQATLIWTKAVLVISRMQLSMVSSMLNSLVTIIGIATVMHVTVRYRESRMTRNREESLRQTIRELAGPIFWTTATTMAGFASLLTSDIHPVASFGVMMTLGTMLVMATCATILPGLILFGASTPDPQSFDGEERVVQALGRLTESVVRHPWVTSFLMLGLSGFCGWGLFHLHVETDFSKNFRDHSPIVKALNFVEGHLGGAGNWEVNFPAPEKLDAEYLERVRHLSEKLHRLTERSTPNRLTKVVAFTDGLDLPGKFWPLNWRIAALKGMQSDFVNSLYNPEKHRMRIMLRALERQPSETKQSLIHEVERTAREEFPEAQVTGIYVLLTNLIDSLMGNQLTSFLVSAAFLLILMTLAFRDPLMGICLLLPNVFPIVLVIGTMGWIGLPINIATAMIASVSLGLTVDSSIHYLAGYRMARTRGISMLDALQQTNAGAGLALVFANVALIAGFTVLTLSHFIPLVYFGVLVSVAMLGGLIGNLVLLPLIVRFLDRETTFVSH